MARFARAVSRWLPGIVHLPVFFCAGLWLLGYPLVGDTSDPGHKPTDWTDHVLNRYQVLVMNRLQASPVALEYAADIQPDGRWADIDYMDETRASWAPYQHMARIRVMSRYLSESAVQKQDTATLITGIESGLRHWHAERYQSPNWWFNEIGVPRAVRDTIVLTRDVLSAPVLDAAIEILGQHRMRGEGANLAWSADLALHYGCLTGDMDRIETAAARMWREITVDAAQGIQSDGSFLQHGPRLQTFHYGSQFISSIVDTAWQLAGSPWAIPAAQRAILTDHLLNGPRWMSRGIASSPGTVDRVVARRWGLRPAGGLIPVLDLWMEVDPAVRPDLEAYRMALLQDEPAVLGFRHFPRSDFTVYHRPNTSLFLKTISDRTGLTEVMNRENLKGQSYLHCGDHYVIRDGHEYHGLPPVWNWSRLPGLSMPPWPSQPFQKAFVGGLGNGTSGLATMEYVRKGAETEFFGVRKTWFFHGDTVVCLLGDWTVTGREEPVFTALEQCRWRDTVYVTTGTMASEELEAGTHAFEDLQWLLHNGIGYLPLQSIGVQVKLEEREGEWHSINERYSPEPVRAPVLQVLLEHPVPLLSAGWVIHLDATTAKLEQIYRKPPWKILQNDGGRQVVRFADGVHMAAFFEQGAIEDMLTVDQPCLAMWTHDTLWLCDPTHAGTLLSGLWRGEPFEIELPPGGHGVEFGIAERQSLRSGSTNACLSDMIGLL